MHTCRHIQRVRTVRSRRQPQLPLHKQPTIKPLLSLAHKTKYLEVLVLLEDVIVDPVLDLAQTFHFVVGELNSAFGLGEPEVKAKNEGECEPRSSWYAVRQLQDHTVRVLVWRLVSYFLLNPSAQHQRNTHRIVYTHTYQRT